MGNSCMGKRNQESKILMVGLDRAGKTTTLYFLKYGEAIRTIPTLGFNVETIQYQGYNFVTWDVSGKEKIRRMWKHYYKSTNAIIFVVDSTDEGEERIEECKEALSMFLEENELRGCILLVLANKQDLPDAMSPEEITEKLGLNTIQDRQWHIEGTCATSGEGVYEGLDWLVTALTQQKQSRS